MKDQISNRNKGFFPEGITQGQKTLMGFTLFFLLVFCYIMARAFLGHVIQLPNIPGGPYGKLIPMVALAFLYFTYTRGFKSTLFLTVFVFIYCWAAEECSVHNGFPFGHYYYSDMLGYKLDVVPVTIGLQYFWIYVFPAYFVSNLIAEGKLLGPPKSTGRLLFTAFIASIIVSGIDMAVDPLDATKLSEWVWTKNNYTGYYGIPYMNYLGYVIVMTPAFFIFGLIEKKFDAKPVGPINIYIGAIPLIFYFLSFIMYGVPAPSGVFLVACFTMLFPLILSIDRLKQHFAGRNRPE